MGTGKAARDLIAGRPSSEVMGTELAMRLIIEQRPELEILYVLGREYQEHGSGPANRWRPVQIAAFEHRQIPPVETDSAPIDLPNPASTEKPSSNCPVPLGLNRPLPSGVPGRPLLWRSSSSFQAMRPTHGSA